MNRIYIDKNGKGLFNSRDFENIQCEVEGNTLSFSGDEIISDFYVDDTEYDDILRPELIEDKFFKTGKKWFGYGREYKYIPSMSYVIFKKREPWHVKTNVWHLIDDREGDGNEL